MTSARKPVPRPPYTHTFPLLHASARCRDSKMNSTWGFLWDRRTAILGRRAPVLPQPGQFQIQDTETAKAAIQGSFQGCPVLRALCLWLKQAPESHWWLSFHDRDEHHWPPQLFRVQSGSREKETQSYCIRKGALNTIMWTSQMAQVNDIFQNSTA